MSWLLRHRLKVILSLLLGIGFVYVLKAGAMPLVPTSDDFAQLRPWVVPLYFGLWLSVHGLRATRWYFLLKPLHAPPLREIVSAAFIGFAAIIFLPLRTGEVVRPVLIRRQGKLSGWHAIGTIAAERIIDGLVLSLVLFFALLLTPTLDPLPETIGKLNVSAALVPRAAQFALLVFGTAFGAMAMFYFARDAARKLTRAVIGPFSLKFAEWLSNKVERVIEGLRFLPRLRYSLPFVSITVSYWLLNAGANWVLMRGTGLEDASFGQACVITCVLALGILVPQAPGYFGAFQLSVYAGLAVFFPTDIVLGRGAVVVFVMYLTQLVITLGAGVVCLVVQREGVLSALSRGLRGETTPPPGPSGPSDASGAPESSEITSL